MDHTSLARIDPFPYQHRIADVMSAPVATLAADAPLRDAVMQMSRQRISALIVPDAQDRPRGILTERDIMRGLAAGGGGALDWPVERIMSHPVTCLPPHAFLYAAIARMERLGIRHIAVTDPMNGRLLGIVSGRSLLRQRASQALALGDEIEAAEDGAALAAIRARLPSLARSLLQEGLEARAIAAVISAVLCDVSARAAALAEKAMATSKWGMAPASWCFLVLGSGGRGESLLAADQDNAIVHDGAADDHPWFAELGKRAADILNDAGIPYCQGGVMAMNRECRHNLAGWRARIDLWIADARPEALRNADIFYDFQPVYGDFSLAAALRLHATEAGNIPPFPAILSREITARGIALNFFGGFRESEGRVDLKTGGLLPIVSGARVMALKLGIDATATAARWHAARAAGLIAPEDFARIEDAHDFIMGLVLAQQLADLNRGFDLGGDVEVKRLLRLDRLHLKNALKTVSEIDLMVRNALGLA